MHYEKGAGTQQNAEQIENLRRAQPDKEHGNEQDQEILKKIEMTIISRTRNRNTRNRKKFQQTI